MIADLFSGILRAMYYGTKTLAFILLVCYALVVLFIAFLFTINGARALWFMWTKCQETNLRHKKAMRDVSAIQILC